MIAPQLDVLFCGINPGRYSAAVGHHFAGPGNLFWPTLEAAGFTPRRLTPFEEDQLISLGYGITNLVPRTTAAADELTKDELRAGARLLATKVRRFAPRFVAFVGLQAYRLAFDRPKATVGLQPDKLASAASWLLPNPSGRNAHHPPALLTRMFTELRQAVAERDQPI